MKNKFRVICAVLAAVMVMCLTFTSCGDDRVTIKVYNWGEYINPDMIDAFEEETGIKVIYDTFNDNESMYAKVKNSGDDSYDVIVPSDYMVERMIQEDMLAPLNYDNIPNIVNLDPSFTNLKYDPEGTYSVPYMWNTVGILYDIDQTGRELDSMQDLFDYSFSRKICMLDSIRDTIGMTLKMYGYSLNDMDENHVNQARDKLLEQKEHVLAYGTDEIPPKVMSGTAAMALVYSGEAIVAMSEQPENMRFVVPKEGSNLAIDAMVVLKTTKHQAEAEAFINFMLDANTAYENTTYTGYSTTNAAAFEMLPDEIKNDPARYPSKEVMDKCELFDVEPSSSDLYINAWDTIKAK